MLQILLKRSKMILWLMLALIERRIVNWTIKRMIKLISLQTKFKIELVINNVSNVAD